jgi:phosphate/phosphite/phosphonate ABC transporter binding protein
VPGDDDQRGSARRETPVGADPSTADREGQPAPVTAPADAALGSADLLDERPAEDPPAGSPATESGSSVEFGRGPGTNPTVDRTPGSSPPGVRPPDEALPRLLEGRWRLEREIGAGGMGRVYEARHLTLGNLVAVKLLHPQRLGAPEAVHRFLREARLAGLANHPGIARVLDFDLTADGTPYMVMERLEGTSLEAQISRGKMPLAQGLDIVLDVLDTLAAIHAAGVVHRDIKPGNIFVLAEPGATRTKLLDFGLARGGDPLGGDPSLTRTGQVLGTPHYMSPEQARGQTQVGPEADLWAVGVILYQIATGRRPFPGENYNETLANILTREPAPAREARPELPAALEPILRRSFARDPARRFRTADELRDELRALRDAVARAGDETGRSVLRPRWTLAAAAAIAALGLAIVLGRSGEGATLRVTWSPYRDAAFLAASTRWLFDELGEQLDRPVELAASSSYDEAISGLLQGKVDAAGLSPASYVRARERAPGLVLLARVQSNGADTYQAILFTRAGGAVRDVADARGRSICLVDPTSTSGYLYPRIMLRRAGLDPDRDLGPVVFTGDHERVVAMVLRGDCELAGSSSTAITQWAEEAGIAPASFRILAASDSIPGDALVARPGLADEELRGLRAAVEGVIRGTAEGRYRGDREFSGLVAADDADYDIVRSLDRSAP